MFPFLFLQGGFRNIPLLFENVRAHTAFYSRYIYPRFGFRLFSSLLYDIHWSNVFLENTLWKIGVKMESVCPAVSLVLSCLCLASVFFRLPLWKRTAAVAAVLVSYPINSALYTALYFLPVIIIFLRDSTETDRSGWFLVPSLILLSPVQIPIPYAVLGIREAVLCNLTNILQNLAAFLILLVFAWSGIRSCMKAARKRLCRQATDKQVHFREPV